MMEDYMAMRKLLVKRRYVHIKDGSLFRGPAGTYDDRKDNIVIYRKNFLFRLFPMAVLMHELRHMVYFNWLHPEHKSAKSWLVRLRAEMFAGFPI